MVWMPPCEHSGLQPELRLTLQEKASIFSVSTLCLPDITTHDQISEAFLPLHLHTVSDQRLEGGERLEGNRPGKRLTSGSVPCGSRYTWMMEVLLGHLLVRGYRHSTDSPLQITLHALLITCATYHNSSDLLNVWHCTAHRLDGS